MDPDPQPVQPADLDRERGAGAVRRPFDDPAIGWAILAAVLTCVAGLWVGVRQVHAAPRRTSSVCGAGRAWEPFEAWLRVA